MTDDKMKSYQTAAVYLAGQMDVYVPLLEQIEANLKNLRDHFVVRGDGPNPGQCWHDITDAVTYLHNAVNLLDEFMTESRNINEGAIDQIQMINTDGD